MKFIFMFMIFILTACSGHFEKNDLVGKYILSNPDGIDVIELKSNNDYINSCNTKSGFAQQQQGSWNIEITQSGPHVVLDHYQFICQGKNLKPTDGYTYLLIEKSFGSIYLITDIDRDIGYNKQF